MTDGVLSCREVFAHFSAVVNATTVDRPLSEGAQNALVNLYARLAAACPGSVCEQRDDCVLVVDGRPKRFDGIEGKARFLRMKVRTEGRRVHRRSGSDVLTGTDVDLVGDAERRLGSNAAPDGADRLSEAVVVEVKLETELTALRGRLDEVDLRSLRGGYANVAKAAEIARRLIRRTLTEPLPRADQERREIVRGLMAEVDAPRSDDTPAALRQRQKRLRGLVREVLRQADGAWLADAWVPLEANMQR